MATKRRFDVWFDADASVWRCRYRKYQAYASEGKTPPIALANLIQQLSDAREAGKDITL